MEIDLNCDLGEGAGADDALMPLVTSANVACGFHAGDPDTAHRALELAARHRVAVGAHPGFADREHFGRRDLSVEPEQVFRLCLYQVGALVSLARHVGIALRFIKPHGALYNMACRDEAVAEPVVRAAEFFSLPLVALPESALERLCLDRVRFVREGFADRRYAPDGSLVPRSSADAFVHDPEEAVAQARRLIDGKKVQTLCVHGDHPQAIAFVQRLRESFVRSGFLIRAWS